MSCVQSCGAILLSRYDPPVRKVSAGRQIGHTSEPRSILPAGRLPCQSRCSAHSVLNTSTRLCILVCVNGKRDPQSKRPRQIPSCVVGVAMSKPHRIFYGWFVVLVGAIGLFLGAPLTVF